MTDVQDTSLLAFGFTVLTDPSKDIDIDLDEIQEGGSETCDEDGDSPLLC